jgi:hypothetical protein
MLLTAAGLVGWSGGGSASLTAMDNPSPLALPARCSGKRRTIDY